MTIFEAAPGRADTVEQATGDTRRRASERADAVAGEVAAIIKETWGRGPRRVRVYAPGIDLLVVLLDDARTEAEKALRAAGHDEQVIAQRRMLNSIIEEALTIAVSRSTGRTVQTVLSATRLDPDLTTHVCVLEGEAPVPAGPASARGRDARDRAGELQRAAAVQAQARLAVHRRDRS